MRLQKKLVGIQSYFDRCYKVNRKHFLTKVKNLTANNFTQFLTIYKMLGTSKAVGAMMEKGLALVDFTSTLHCLLQWFSFLS